MTWTYVQSTLRIWVDQETQCIMQCKNERGRQREREREKKNAVEHKGDLQDQQGLVTAPCFF